MRRQRLEELHLLEAAVSGLGIEHVEDLHLLQRDASLVAALQPAAHVLLAHPHADEERVAMTGLSGGGWQTAILSALDDYRHYDDEGMDPEDLIGRTPVLARVNAIEDKISDAFANQ